jgi:hypothetical protein
LFSLTCHLVLPIASASHFIITFYVTSGMTDGMGCRAIIWFMIYKNRLALIDHYVSWSHYLTVSLTELLAWDWMVWYYDCMGLAVRRMSQDASPGSCCCFWVSQVVEARFP